MKLRRLTRRRIAAMAERGICGISCFFGGAESLPASRRAPKPRRGGAKADKKSEAQISYFNYTLFPLDFQINSY